MSRAKGKAQAVRVYWCASCHAEGDKPLCKCGKVRQDLGFKVGESYYSTVKTLPRGVSFA